jgi:hypothetical protein
VLLGGPGGLYGDDYLSESTPEQDVGGITCIWGSADTEISSVTVSVAPLKEDTRDLVVDSLLAQGLNEVPQDTSTYYAESGDEDGSAAILNVIENDSWISVIQTKGGDDSFAEAVDIAAETHDRVYR